MKMMRDHERQCLSNIIARRIYGRFAYGVFAYDLSRFAYVFYVSSPTSLNTSYNSWFIYFMCDRAQMLVSRFNS